MTGTAHTPLPCPFCGGEAKTISPLGFGNVRAIECCNSDDCAATGPWACNEAEALTAWNTRADSHHRLVEALEAMISATGEHDWNCSIGALYNCTCDLHGAKERARAALREVGRG